MDCSESRKIEIYAPYYFKIGNIFSKEFFQYSVCEVEVRNELPMIIEEHSAAQGALLIVKCAIDPLKCSFRMEFKEERGDNYINGYKLVKIIGIHICQKLSPAQEKRVLKQRKGEIKHLRGLITKIVAERYSLFGHQPSKIILEKLALKLDQYPNFLYRRLNKNMQACIKKKFMNEVCRLRKKLGKKEEINYDQQSWSKESLIEEFVDSDSEFSCDGYIKSTFGSFKE